MPANTYGRQVVLPLTNKSGGSVAAGDVVVIDTTNNDSFTTSTAGSVTNLGIGVAQETIANNATGRVCIGGYVALVNVNASVTRGNYGKTYTVAKQATDAGASRVAGAFCQFLTGGTTPDAYIYQPDLGGASLTNPMTTTGDLIVGGSSGTPARLAVGTSSQALIGGSTPAWSSAVGILQASRVSVTGGNLTTTSTSFADATGLTTTITTGARRCLVFFQAVGHNDTSHSNYCVDLAVDGTRVGQAFGLALVESTSDSAHPNGSLHFTWLTDVLSAASHTFKIQHRVDGGTGTMFATTTVSPATITVLETGLTS
jgi:hypothetical protein